MVQDQRGWFSDPERLGKKTLSEYTRCHLAQRWGFSVKTTLVIVSTVFLLALTVGCGGSNLSDSCTTICDKLVSCLGGDQDGVAMCRGECQTRGEQDPACEQAYIDAEPCFADLVCQDYINMVACVEETVDIQVSCQ